MKIKDFMEAVNYRITETSDYLWACYGHDACSMDSHAVCEYKVSSYGVSIVFDTKNHTVYEMTACDYVRDRAYLWIHPDYVKARADECKSRGHNNNKAWDDVQYAMLDVEEDILEKATALAAGEDYDTRIMVSVEFTDEDALKYMMLAHEQDITFNKFVELALESMLAKLKLERDENDCL